MTTREMSVMRMLAKTSTRMALLAVLWFVIAPAFEASAQYMAHHTSPRVTPRVRNGRVVGVRIRTTLRKANYMYSQVALVLLTTGNLPESDRTRNTSTAPHRLIVGGIGEHANSPYVRYRSAQHEIPTENTDVTLDLDYGDGPNDLRPGERVELASAWTPGDYVHVWGYSPVNNDPGSIFTLPGQPATRPAATRTASAVRSEAARVSRAARAGTPRKTTRAPRARRRAATAE